MWKYRFTETQVVDFLKAHDAGVPTAELAQTKDPSRHLRQLRAKYGGMDVGDIA